MSIRDKLFNKKISIKNSEFYLSLLILLIFLVFYFLRIVNIQREFIQDGWIGGDWLINYSGGFIRRGGFGEIIRFINHETLIPAVSLIFYFKCFCYFSILALTFYLCCKNKIGIIEIILLVSPWSFIFDLNYVNGSGRKEIILLLIFIIFILLYEVKNSYKFKVLFSFLLLVFPLLVLLHEGLFFFLQFFPFYVGLRSDFDARLVRLFLIPYAAAFFCLLIAYVFIGDIVNSIAICSSLQLTLNDSLCAGAISSLGGYHFQVTSGFFKTYIPIFILSFMPLICYGASVLHSGRNTKFIIYTAFSIGLTFPLYWLASDWGRWIHVTAIILFFTILGSKTTDLVQFKKMSPIVIFFILITPFIYIFNWRIPHVIDPDAVAIWRSQDFSGWVATFFLNN
jgi:hypothetical protein